jgi:colicin import membrane protein
MSRTLQRGDSGFGKALAISAGLHLTLFFVLSTLDLLALAPINLQPTCYVDLTSLPTASPGGGAATPEPAPPAPEPTAEKASGATLPSAPTKSAAPDRAKEAGEFEKRLENLSRTAEERHQQEALANLRNKLAASSGSGPAKAGGKGSDPLGGSDYGSYVQSRLEDAFGRTIASQSSDPEAVVRLTIDRNGRIIRQRFERSSGDRLFEDAVRRAIALAEKSFPPNPAGEQYENGFVFRPKGKVTR